MGEPQSASHATDRQRENELRASAGTETLAEYRSLLEHRERQIEAIRRTSDTLFVHPSVDAMVEATLRIALDVLRADAGTVFLYDPDDDSLVFRYVIGPAAEKLIGVRLPSSHGGVAWTVFRTHKPDLTGNVALRGDFNRGVDEKTGYHTESMMTVPVKRTDSDPIGVMQVLNARVPFTDRDLEVLEVLCAQAATGIEHAKLTEDARKAEIVHVIGDISHDIKNMLTPILTGIWTLEPMLQNMFRDLEHIRITCPDTETWADDIEAIAASVRDNYGWMLENVLHSAEQVQSRTKEIADAVKGDMTPPFFEEADLNETTEAIARPLKVVADKAGIALILDLEPNLPTVEYDRKQIYNALYNLVNNAIPETPTGGTITVRTRSYGDDMVQIDVADTGKGIPEHVRARLFTDSAISTKPGGTGLGTRIVAGVIRRHNGKISVETELGRGSTFTVRLPLRHR
jgi:signal transduction histidine kinase